MACFYFKKFFNHSTKRTIATTKFNETKMPEKSFKIAIIYVDFTKSTILSKIGRLQNLHNEVQPNPFEILLSAFVEMLWDHIELNLETNMKYIRLYGFGCIKTQDKSVFYMHPNGSKGASGKTVKELETNVLLAYRKVRNEICSSKDNLSGPTDYSPSIYTTLNSMIEEKSPSGELPNTFMGMLLDGQTDAEEKTKEAISRATFFPVSIVLCAIGNNSFKKLQQYDELGNFRFKDNVGITYGTYRDIVQSTLANDFVLWVMANQRRQNNPRYKIDYQKRLNSLKSDIMNEIPEQSKQITSDILKYDQTRHGKKCNPNIIVFDCERKNSSTKHIPAIPTVPAAPSDQTVAHTAAQNQQTSGLEDMQNRQTSAPNTQQTEQLCVVCYENSPNCFLNPCGHIGLCLVCAQRLMNNRQPCPICRQNITTAQRYYNPQ